MRTQRSRSFRLSAGCTLGFAAAMLAVASPARANGAFPDEFSLHFPANAPHRILIGANFGLLVSEDDGATWRYSCEPWVTVGSNDPLSPALVTLYEVTADGAVLADSVNVTRSTDACSWPAATGAVAGGAVDDLFPDPSDANFVLAALSTSTGSYLIASHDGGKTFDPTILKDVRPNNEIFTGVEIARSQRGVFYATTVSINGGLAKFYASTDFGATWPTALTFPDSSGVQPRILAVDPVDAKTVYLRMQNGASDALAVTHDGGQTFTTPLPINGQLSSFLRAGDGTIYAGTIDGRLFVQPPATSGFTQRTGPHLRCLGQRPGTTQIYACGDYVADGFCLGVSNDNGVTFQRVMSFPQLLGPLTCAPVQTNCQPHWERIQGVLGITASDGGTSDGGGGGGGAGPGGSHCGSTGADAWSLWFLVGFACRQALRSRRR